MANHHQERERAAVRHRQRQHESATATEAPTSHPLVALGQQVGNAAINRMLAQREALPEEEEELQMSRDPALQREAQPEEEEEELQMSRDPALQREAGVDEAPEVGLEGGPVSEATAGRIEAMRGGGSPLDEGTRSQMEGTLGADFSAVRVHTGSESARLNRSLGARAFTTGSDVFFGAGASPGDKSLLAHELTHVVQQRGMSGGGPLTVGPADDAYEAEAEATAQTVAAGAAPAQRAEEQEP